MSINYVPELPIARVVLGGQILKTFVGEGAAEAASDFIGSMPNPEDGRFGLDVSDDYCAECGATFWHEAWVANDEEFARNEWHCPECDAIDRKGVAA